MTSVDVLILGAGAAGLMAGIEAGRRGRSTLVLDHADSPGKKILISGGGRCNFTNIHAASQNFLSENPHFAKSALTRYTPQDFLALVERHRIPYHEKTLGQLFCDRSAHDILNMLLAECAETAVQVQLSTSVLAVSREATGFVVETSRGGIQCSSLIVATGGLSIPKMGATDFGYNLARQLGLQVVEPRPVLVPLVFTPEDQGRWCDLTGLSAEVIVSAEARSRSKGGRVSFREKMLITHRGLSGPAILQISSYWRPGEAIVLDLAPGHDVTEPLLSPGRRRDHGAIAVALRAHLAGRLADRWLRLHPPAARDRDPTKAALAEFERGLHAWRITPAGTEGFAKAEVTAGGVSTSELDARTMQSTRVPGLYFIGEVVDVTGWLGGYNFQWAWASGAAAGRAA